MVLVSATNGKTTTTRLLAEALRANGPVVSNALGANMPAGITSALAGGSDARYGVIEVDEKYLAGVARDVAPEGHRAAQPLPRPARPRRRDPDARREVARGPGRFRGDHHRQRRRPADHLGRLLQPDRGVGRRRPGVEGRRLVLPVLRRRAAAPRPTTGSARECGFRRPTPTWALSGDHVVDPYGVAWPIHLQLPGRANKSNAAVSAAAAAAFGVDPKIALERMYKVQAVAGRYDVVTYQQRELRLLLAKNPAGWLETFSLIDGPPTPVMLSVNARGADGTDTSWLWDVDYTRLAGHPILVIGDRKLDLAVRLEVAGLQLPGLRRPGRGGALGAARPDRDHRQLHRLPGPAPQGRQLTAAGRSAFRTARSTDTARGESTHE